MGDMMDDDLCIEDDFDDLEDIAYEPKASCPVEKPAKIENLTISRLRTIHLLEEEEDENSDDVESVIDKKLVKCKSAKVEEEHDFISKAQSRLDRLSPGDINKMVIELLHERMSYKEKLRIAKGAIVSRDSKISMLKSQSKILPMNMSESNIHLAFLFSSPLVRKRARLENIMQLDYLTEISDIVQVLQGIQFELKYKTDVATVSNLRSTITDLPIVLHFSGHGIQNTLENLGQDYHFSKEKGNILLLENERGMSDYFFQKDLDELLELVHQSKNPFEVVFVSSCYSQFAGEIFLKAKAKHVICIRSGEQIADAASLRFSKVFYNNF